MTVKEALKSGSLNNEVLLAHVLKKDRSWLFANPDHQLSRLQLTTYNLLLRGRSRGVPAAYLTGHKEFFGLDFRVTPATLIPRPETELLVERALSLLPSPGVGRDRGRGRTIENVIDVGTGSGCIIISLAKNIRNAKIKFLATDISKPALKIAKHNAIKHGVSKKIKFLQGNLLSGLQLTTYNLPTLILANLPYLTPGQMKNPDLKHEPRSALVAGTDGLKYYRELFAQASRSKLRNSVLIIEHDPRQKPKLASLVKKHFPSAKFRFHKDLAGRYRILEIQI